MLIDVLRGFCILSVILLHLNIKVPFKETFIGTLMPKKIYTLFFWSGYYGVIIFFTLSGYLITNSVIRKWGKLSQIKVRDFFVMRAARIMPLLFILILVLTVLHIMSVPGFIIDKEKVSLGIVIFSAATFHINLLQIKIGYLPANWDVLWSICIEGFFYLIFPFLCLIIRKKWHLAVLILIIILIAPWARIALYPVNELGDRNYLAYMDSIGIGCIIALGLKRLKCWIEYDRIGLFLGASMLILVLYFRGFLYQSGLVSSGLNVTILSLGTGLMIIWMHFRQDTLNHSRFWLLKMIGKMGRLSYEIYLTHIFIVIVLVDIYNRIQAPSESIYLLYITTVMLSSLLAKYVSKYISKPLSNKIQNKFIYKRKPICKLNQ
ncbi:Peptidoglycan/LPS O-acetylase OafA/YrhL, contains acyltransferase and SGNH-hydrolase domains [Arenibacter palladensis]|uniref:Peptidoglycan/LPS O-acetylase OafA/YrhL, contains acyltransferase and SGNH-hydrolase domains n=2 Tax=Arenibacter palladensis TaxID=237373 RepID=A0A1M4Y0N9_9FLAO|nr:Peptidoglycan/LPS O-acetylase OafA/YrhL, contains acyltransferase and SGNH-hydrolase domains [Arenibacter palladensis]